MQHKDKLLLYRKVKLPQLTSWICKRSPKLLMVVNSMPRKLATAYTKPGTVQPQLVFMHVPYLKDTQLSLLLIDSHFWWIHSPYMNSHLLCKIWTMIFFFKTCIVELLQLIFCWILNDKQVTYQTIRHWFNATVNGTSQLWTWFSSNALSHDTCFDILGSDI